MKVAWQMNQPILCVLYDTGRRVTLTVWKDPFCSLWFVRLFVNHEGDLLGWRHKLEGATKVAGTDNWYHLQVDGKATITNTIEAIEPHTVVPAQLAWWHWLIILAILLLLFILFWRRSR